MPAQGEHNKWIALALCNLLGYLGMHRFYEGKSGRAFFGFAPADSAESASSSTLFSS